MPTPALQPPSPEMSFDETKSYLIGVIRQLNWLLSALDTLNINRLDAKIVVTGTLDAGKVTIRTDLNGGAYIVLDSNGIVVNNGTKDVFKVDTNGNVTLNDVTSTGGTIRTATSGARVELSSNTLKTFNDSGKYNGPVWGSSTVGGTQFGDVIFYHNDIDYMEIKDDFNFFSVRPRPSATKWRLGLTSKQTLADGDWLFQDSVDSLPTATHKIHGGTPLDTISQPNSTATTVAGLVADLNTLLSNLRAMNILA